MHSSALLWSTVGACLLRTSLSVLVLSDRPNLVCTQWAEFRDAKHDLFQQTGGDMLLLEGGSMETLLLTDGGAGGYVPPNGPDGEDEAI